MQECFFGNFFHFCPDVAAVHRVSVSCDEYHSAFDVFLFAVVEQFPFQFVYEIDLAVFFFAGYADFSGLYGIQCDGCKLTNTHAGATDGLIMARRRLSCSFAVLISFLYSAHVISFSCA